MESAILGLPILVVDDTAAARELVVECLSEEGFSELSTAVDGEDALEKMRANKPDLVILDLLMPKLDGKAVCRAMRADAQLADIPILVQTALDLNERVAALDAGASDVMPKPLHIPELLARTRIHLLSLLHRRERDAFSERIREEIGQAVAAQRSLLPEAAELERIRTRSGVQVDLCYRPCSELGGDLPGVRLLSDGSIVLFMFDFAGHGMVSALNTFRLHALFTEVESVWSEPVRLLNRLNGKLRRCLPAHQFTTAFWGVVDPRGMRLRYASAGAPGCLHLGAAGDSGRWLDTRGFPLGILDDPDYREYQIDLAAGDRLLLFSDALIETPVGDGLILEETRLAQWARSAIAGDSEVSLADAVSGRFLDACEGEVTDDLTLLSVHVA